MNTSPIVTVPNAQAGEISDATLTSLIQAGQDLQAGKTISQEAGELLLIAVPQALDELLRRRQVMNLIGEASNLDNVRFFPT